MGDAIVLADLDFYQSIDGIVALASLIWFVCMMGILHFNHD